MPGMASTVSVICVRPSLCHVCFLEEKNPVFCFNFVSSSSIFFTFRNQTCMF